MNISNGKPIPIYILTIIAALTIMVSSCKPKQTVINGQVFIATQGGESIRLGAVEILLVDKNKVTNYLQKIKVQIDEKIKSGAGIALQAYQQTVRTTQLEVDVAKQNLSDKKQGEEEAQNKFDEAREKYDQIMASAPFLTNVVFVRIKKDLNLRTQQIPYLQQSIKIYEEGVAQNSHAAPPEYVAYLRNPGGYWKAPDDTARLGALQEFQVYLAKAELDLSNDEKQFQADNEALEKIISNFDNVQSSKLNEAQSALDTANLSLNEAQSMLASKESNLQQITSQGPNYKHTASNADYLSDFSVPIISKVNSDADGNFSILCPGSGRFSIFASAQRQTISNSGKYYWLVDAPDKNKNERIFLNNNNLIGIDPDGYFKP